MFVAMLVQDSTVSSVAIVHDDPISIVLVMVGLVCMLRNAILEMHIDEFTLANAIL